MSKRNKKLKKEIKALKLKIATVMRSTDGNASAVCTMGSRVTASEGTITSQGTVITSLRNDLFDVNTRVTALESKEKNSKFKSLLKLLQLKRPR